MTVLLSITISEKVLPPQLLYLGKTARFHPTEAQFPSDWYVTHTTNHWSNETSMLEFAEKILLPYVNDTKAALELSQEICAIAFLDVFAAHRCTSILSKLTEAKIKICFTPAGCT